MSKNRSRLHTTTTQPSSVTNFRTTRAKELEVLYSDNLSTNRRYDRAGGYSGANSSKYSTAAAVRAALATAARSGQVKELVTLSKQLYATNPVYSSIINYLTGMFRWDYKVIPHKLYTKSKAKNRKQVNAEEYMVIYNYMLELVEGLALKIKGPAILQNLFIDGSVYYTTLVNEENMTIDTIILPGEYCRKIGETQYGTNIISFNVSYFRDVGLKEDEINEYFESFPEEFAAAYRAYLADSTQQWAPLDPRFSSGMLLNDAAIPTYLYLLGGILDFEKYQDNELERNENSLKYLVVHTIPHYEDQLIFEVDEAAALHKSLKAVVDTGEKARLITTWGDVHVEKISENDTSENEVLTKAFKAIFQNAGFNSGVFTSESVEALKMSLIRDKAIVWKYIKQLVNFYNVALNNHFEFKGYQADIDILQISSYTYSDDIEIYKTNATLGVNKLDFIIASGIEQKHISDILMLEKTLGLDNITPMQTSYTQTAEDRQSGTGTQSSSDKKTEIEPSDNKSVNDTAE